jgi:hypothetical protein
VKRAPNTPDYMYDDGGRAKAGYPGKREGDCTTRAISIATQLPYAETFAGLVATSLPFGLPINGGPVGRAYLTSLGWVWTATPPAKGGRCVTTRGLPRSGRLVARQAHHLAAVVNGRVHDLFDSSSRMVYGYWSAQ